jgi:hypothetical protein
MPPLPRLATRLLASLMLASPAVLAHKAHEHGVAQLDLVREGDGIEIALKVDGEGVVGFERAPRDDAERARLEAARVALAAGQRLFGLPEAAGCRLLAAEVEAPHAGDTANPDRDAMGSGHADWQASYRFECARAAAADRVELAGLFTAFPGIARVQLQWITDDAQSGVELRPGRSQATLVAE